MNQYVTVRTAGFYFFVNAVSYDGTYVGMGTHRYFHKRSARRAAIALAKKLDISYRQDLEYVNTPYAFVAEAPSV